MANLEIYDSLYFRMNKKHLSFIGLWPYDPTKKIVPLLCLSVVAILNYPHLAGIIVHMTDVDRLLEHVIIFFILVQLFLKYWSIYVEQTKLIFILTVSIKGNLMSFKLLNPVKIKSVYDDIANIWSMITDEEEKKILIEYSKVGRILTLAYLGLLVNACIFFIIVPLIPEVLNVAYPLPVPRPHISTLNGEFLVSNPENYFLLIYSWEATSVIATCVISHAVDGMFMVSVEQARALYAILSYRLSKLRYRSISDSKDGTDGSYEWMVHTIKLHQMILSYINNINDALSLCFIGLTVMNIVALPISCVVLLIHLNDPMNLIRWTFVVVVLILHLFVQFWPGQKISQSGYALIQDAYYNDWYETPPRTKKLLQIFMIRCSQPPLLTAGGLVEMNFEVYAQVIKTAASYVTVLSSFR